MPGTRQMTDPCAFEPVALHDVIATHGGMTHDQAVDYVKQMKKDKRYQRDVY